MRVLLFSFLLSEQQQDLDHLSIVINSFTTDHTSFFLFLCLLIETTEKRDEYTYLIRATFLLYCVLCPLCFGASCVMSASERKHMYNSFANHFYHPLVVYKTVNEVFGTSTMGNYVDIKSPSSHEGLPDNC